MGKAQAWSRQVAYGEVLLRLIDGEDKTGPLSGQQSSEGMTGGLSHLLQTVITEQKR